MAAITHSQFHELVVQSQGEIPLKKMCEQQGVSYWAYMKWRSRAGLSPLRLHRTSLPIPSGMVEMIADGMPSVGPSPIATAVHIEFTNGLRFDRVDMDVDTLVRFLIEIRGALCLG